LVPNVAIPHKFKTPNFEKYKGDTCPQNHLIMYARKMQAYKDNEPLLSGQFGWASKYMVSEFEESCHFRETG